MSTGIPPCDFPLNYDADSWRCPDCGNTWYLRATPEWRRPSLLRRLRYLRHLLT